MSEKPKAMDESIKKWIIDLLSSLRILPKRPDVPARPTHPSETKIME